MTRIAFIGLGNMGLPMAANLLKAGHAVTGYDLVPAALDAHRAAGGAVADSPRAAAAGADIIITMLPAGAHVRAVLAGPDGLIAARAGTGALLIDSSTIDVETARALAAEAAAAGLDMLDAPVSGGVGGATAGTLTFMVGGSAAGLKRAHPVLAAMGRSIVHAGGPGAGQSAKVCNNMILAVSMLAVSEGFVLADKLGLAREKMFEIVAASTGQCWSLTGYCPVPGPVPAAPSNRDYAAGFAAALMLKDLKLGQDAAAATGAPTPLGAHATALYQRIADAGLAGKDFSVAFPFLAARTRAELVEG